PENDAPKHDARSPDLLESLELERTRQRLIGDRKAEPNHNRAPRSGPESEPEHQSQSDDEPEQRPAKPFAHEEEDTQRPFQNASPIVSWNAPGTFELKK